MSNTKFKTVSLFDRKHNWIPSKERVSGFQTLEGWWSRNVMASSDNWLAQGAKSVFNLNMGGARDFLATSSLAPSGTWPTDPWWGLDGGLSGTILQMMPEPDIFRTIGHGNFTVTPGNWLRARVLCADSGETQGQGYHGESNLWWNSGTFGELVLSCTFENISSQGSNSEQVNKRKILPHSNYPSGTLDSNNSWKNLRTVMISEIMPANFKIDRQVGANYSELTNCEIHVLERGSPRLVHLNITEFPVGHSHPDDETFGQSAHAYANNNGKIPGQVVTDYPQTEEIDGANWADLRFGSFAALSVLNNQIDRLGPNVFNWSSWSHTGSAPSTTEMAIGMTTSWQSIPFDSATWSMTGSGWVNPTADAQQYRRTDPKQILKGKRASMPVRIRIRAAVSGNARVRMQTCAHSFYEFAISAANGGQLWYEDLAYLEGGIAQDDMEHNFQLFGRLDDAGSSFAITNVQVIFGDYPTRT